MSIRESMIDVFRHFCSVTPATKEDVAAEAVSQGFEAFELSVHTRRDPALEIQDTALVHVGVVFTDKRVDLSRMYQTAM